MTKRKKKAKTSKRAPKPKAAPPYDEVAHITKLRKKLLDKVEYAVDRIDDLDIPLPSRKDALRSLAETLSILDGIRIRSPLPLR